MRVSYSVYKFLSLCFGISMAPDLFMLVISYSNGGEGSIAQTFPAANNVWTRKIVTVYNIMQYHTIWLGRLQPCLILVRDY